MGRKSLRRPGLLRRYAPAALIAAGLHAVLAVLWPEPAAPTFVSRSAGEESGASGASTMELTLMEEDDSLLGEIAEAAPAVEARPAQPDNVIVWDFDPDIFTQDAAPDAPELLDPGAALAGQIDSTLAAALRELQQGLDQVSGRRGRGFSAGKAGVLYAPNPPYPPLARREGREGIVEILVLVDSRGRAGRAEVAHSSGYADLDESALNTVMTRWKFPARENELQIVRVIFSLTRRDGPETTVTSKL